MTKAILVIDEIPMTCAKCRFYTESYNYIYHEGIWMCNALIESLDCHVESERYAKCPLKPMPERINPLKVDCSNLLDLGYMHGRNDLINEILEESEHE